LGLWGSVRGKKKKRKSGADLRARKVKKDALEERRKNRRLGKKKEGGGPSGKIKHAMKTRLTKEWGLTVEKKPYINPSSYDQKARGPNNPEWEEEGSVKLLDKEPIWRSAGGVGMLGRSNRESRCHLNLKKEIRSSVGKKEGGGR